MGILQTPIFAYQRPQGYKQRFLWYHFFFFYLQVSWIRTRGIRVLAIGKVRYTQDTRFTPLHEEGNDVWVLKIQETRLSDAGLYECQVSYHEDVEKKLKMPVRLIVLGKRRRVIHVMYSALNLNSPLNFECTNPNSTLHLIWCEDPNVTAF